jgi:hypothetical protein
VRVDVGNANGRAFHPAGPSPWRRPGIVSGPDGALFLASRRGTDYNHAQVQRSQAMLRVVLAIVVVLLGFGAVTPQPASAVKDWNRTDDTMAAAVGLHAGKIGGTGLAFVVPLTWFIHAQFAGGVWNTEGDHRYNVGLEFHYLLRQDPKLRLFLIAGAAYYSHDEQVNQADGTQDWNLDKSTNAGFGVGVERLIGDRWALKLDLDFTYEGDDGDIRPWPQAGLFFYW